MDWKKIRTSALAALLCVTMLPVNVLADYADDWSEEDEYVEEYYIPYLCGLEEHIHEDECYFRELICDEGHSDDEHTAACFNNMFICGYEEHVHEEAKCNGMEAPMLFSAGYDDANGGSDYYNIISQKEWTLAPGITETEIVMNNDAGTRRQVMHTAVIDLNNDFVKVIPGTKGMWPEEGNYGTQSTSVQALEAEALGYGNVVVATNASLSWYTEAYYKENPHLIGEPLGYSILDGQLYANSRWVEGSASGGVQTITVINYDYHPITGEKRPDDMPKAWIRNATDPLTGWEEQAIPVLFTYLVKPDENGNPVNQYKEDHGSGIASRTFVGVTADGELVLAVSDGEQAPYSTGLTSYEMAEYMIKMGCIIAANCDGGGSTTFCSQRPGEDLKVNCSLSDGGERPTSNTFLVVSTAPADGEFANATISTDYDYYTPGASVTFNALGSDAVGTKVEIPADIEWQIEEEGMGTIENGVFTSNGTEGKVTVQMVYNGDIVGEKSITIVTPDAISFDQPIITVPYGKTAKIPVKATAAIDGVAQEIGLGANDVTFTTTNEALGQFDGLFFTAVSEADATEDVTAEVTATLNFGNSPTATVQLNLGAGSVVLWDFEDGQTDIDEWYAVNNRKNAAHWDYDLNLSLADRTNGQVHDGNYSMRLETNGLSSKDSHSEQYAWIRLGTGDAIELENARRVGFWLYVPEDNIQCWVQWHYKTDSNGDGVFDTDNVVSVMESENVYYNIDESGWHYLSMDISAFDKISMQSDKKYDLDPSDGMTGETGELFLAIVFHKGINNKLWQENGSINGNYTYYLDNFTVDYSDAVEDRENPVFGKAYVNGKALVKRDVVTTTSGSLELSADVEDKDYLLDVNKNKVPLHNISDLDADTAKVYVDGVEVESTFSNGVISADTEVADGYHRVKFEICDNAGNKSVIIRVIKVESGAEESTINVVPADPTLDRIPFGSIYSMNLEATQIETIQSVETVIDLNNVNHWQLDHMALAEGFSATYTIAEETNTATITITRTGDNSETGAVILAQLPVRILYFDTDIQTPGYTAETYWTSYPFWAQDMKMDVDMGLITHEDGTTSTFSNEEFHVDTEMYTIMANMDKEYFSAHGTTHVHTPVEIDSVEATCSQPGYEGGTFCYECNSPVEWGEVTASATGHKYEVNTAERTLACECGETITGTGLMNVDGKNYYIVNGTLNSGWITVDDEWYCFDAATFAGLDGDHYNDQAVLFNYDNGRLTSGAWAKTKSGTRYWYGPGYYKDTSADKYSSRPYEIDGKTYLFSRQGYVQTGITYYLYAYSGDGNHIIYYYDCGEDGVATLLTAPYNGYYYLDGVKQKAYKMIQHTNGDLYFISDGHKLAKDCTIYLAEKFLNGCTYPDGTRLTEGYYTFDSDGRVVVKNGVIDGYMYINGARVNTYTLVKYDGDYYFVSDGRKVAVDTTLYLSEKFVTGFTYEDGTSLKPGYYTFDSEGKMVIKNGVIDGYMYINGTRVNTYTLVKYDGDYYFVSDYRKVVVDTTLYLSEKFVTGFTYDDGTSLIPGYYTFDSEGKMVMGEEETPQYKNGVIDGYLYIDNVKQTAYKLVKYDSDYYFINDGHKVAMGMKIYLSERFVTDHTYEDGTPLKPGYFTFDDEGKMVIKNGVIDGYMYINGARVNTYTLVKYDGDYYFVSDGRKVAVDTTLYLSERFVAGFTYEDGTSLKPGYFTFDNEGKMVIKNGVIDGYMYINGTRVETYALVEYDGNFYFVGDYRKVVTDTKIWLSAQYVAGKTWPDGSMIEVGYHYFDETGKMVY